MATLDPDIPSAVKQERVASPHLLAQRRGDLLDLEVAENLLPPPLLNNHPANSPQVPVSRQVALLSPPGGAHTGTRGWLSWQPDLKAPTWPASG